MLKKLVLTTLLIVISSLGILGVSLAERGMPFGALMNDGAGSGAEIRIGRDIEGDGIKIMPGEMEVSILPGATTQPQFTIQNTGQKEIDYSIDLRVVSEPEKIGLPDVTGTRWLVMQDQQGNGWLGASMVARVKGVKYDSLADYTKIGSPQIDLSQYDGVIVAANNQTTTWQNALIANRAWFESYVTNGGALYMETGGNSGFPWIIDLPGGIPGVYRSYSTGRILLSPAQNALVKACGWQAGQTLSSNWMRTYYPVQALENAKLPWYQVIGGANDNADPCLIAYGLGKGGVLVYGGLMGYQWLSNTADPQVGSKPTQFLQYIKSLSYGSWIKLSNNGGKINTGDSRAISVNLNTRGLMIGDYNAKLKVKYSNDPDLQDLEIDIRMSVAAAPDIAVEWAKTADYPNGLDWNKHFPYVFTSARYDIPLKVSNMGNRPLKITEVRFEGSNAFRAPREELSVAPGATGELNIRLQARESDVHEGRALLFTNDPDKPVVEIELYGETVDPPLISVDVDEIDLEMLSGDLENQDITVSNVGDSPLDYSAVASAKDKAKPFGEKLRTYQWARMPNQNMYRLGLAYDRSRNWMWLTYNAGAAIGAIDLGNNNNEVMYRSTGYSVGGMALVNNQLYCITYGFGTTAYIFDTALNLITTWNPKGWTFYSIASDPINNLLLVRFSSNHDYIYIYDAVTRTELGYVTGVYNVSDGNTCYGMTYVPEHPHGGLYIFSGNNRIHQVQFDPVKRVLGQRINVFTPSLRGYSSYEGLGWDGTDLWHGSYSENFYQIYSDGFDERPWLRMESADGSVNPGEEAPLSVIIDANYVIGDKVGTIKISSNDPFTPLIEIPVTVSISDVPRAVVQWSDQHGYPENINWNKISFDLYPNTAYIYDVVVKNPGTQQLNVQNITSNNARYSFSPTNFSVAKKGQQTVRITFNPNATGNFNANMTIQSNAGDGNVVIPMTAAVKQPPKITVNPANINDAAATGENYVGELTIGNTGEGPLAFNTSFTLANNSPIGAGTNLGTFEWSRNVTSYYRSGIAYDPDRKWIWLSCYNINFIGAVDPNDGHKEVKSFAFNQGGNARGMAYHNGILYIVPWSNSQLQRWDVDGRYIGAWAFGYYPGAVTVVPERNEIFCIGGADPNTMYVHDLASGSQLRSFSGVTTVCQGYQSQSLVWVPGHVTGKLWFQSQSSDGWGMITQANLNTANWTMSRIQSFRNPIQLNDTYSGLGHDGVNLIYGPRTNGANKYYYVDDGYHETRVSAFPATGVVDGGDNTEMYVAIDTRGLNAGNFDATLFISHNDPSQNAIQVPIRLNVQNSPNAQVTWDKSFGYPIEVDWNLRFPDVYPEKDYKIDLTLTNTGVADLNVNEITIDDGGEGVFSVAQNNIQGIKAGLSTPLRVAFKANDVGDYEGVMTIKTNGALRADKVVHLTASATTKPVIEFDQEELVSNLNLGQKDRHILNIANTGGGDLRVSMDVEFIDLEAAVRDVDGQRNARRLDDGEAYTPGPSRDQKKLGEEVGRVYWEYNYETYDIAGISWDKDREWMWVTNYNNNYIAALSKANNWAEVFRRSPSYNPYDGVYYNNYFFYTYGGNSSLYRTDAQGNYLGYVNVPWGLYSLDVDPETGTFMATTTQGTQYLQFFTYNVATGVVTALGTVTDFATKRGNVDSYARSIVWVPQHKGGNLWANTSNYIWQYDIDIKTYTVKGLKQSWAKPFASRSDTDGIGHDGRNLWLKERGSKQFRVTADGIDEIPWLITTFTSAKILPDRSIDIDVRIDATEKSGEYKANLVFTSNDPDHSVVKIPVTLNVRPEPKLDIKWSAGFPDKVDWNKAHPYVFAEGKYEIPLTLTNLGTGRLDIEDIVSDNAAFTPPAARQLSLLPEQSRVITIAFKTDNAGQYVGKMTFKSNDLNNREQDINLSALASVGPNLVVEPNRFDLEMITGQRVADVMNLSNTGGSDLVYSLDYLMNPVAGRDDAEQRIARRIDEQAGPTRDKAFGDVIRKFTWSQTYTNRYKGGIAWDRTNDWMWLAAQNTNYVGAVDLQDDLKEVKLWNANRGIQGIAWYNNLLYTWYYGFSSTVYIYDINGNNVSNWNMPYSVSGIASDPFKGWLFVRDENAKDINVYNIPNQQLIGSIKNYRQFIQNNETRSLLWVPEHRDGQLWMNTSNKIWQLAIDPVTWQVTKLVRDFTPGYPNYTERDGLGHDGVNLWYGNYGTNEYIIMHDGIRETPFIVFDPAGGVLAPGENVNIGLTFDVSTFVGKYGGYILVNSNNPKNRAMKIPVDVTIDKAPELQATWPGSAGYPNALDYGKANAELYSGAEFSIPIMIANEGSDWLDVMSITAGENVYSISPTRFSLDVGKEQKVTVRLKVREGNEGNYNDELTIRSSDPNSPEIIIPIVAEVATAPVFGIDEANMEIAVNVAKGANLNYPIAIENPGGSNLRYSVTMPDDALRDYEGREARRLDEEEGIEHAPYRDAALGTELGTVSWAYAGNGYYNVGIAWHAESQLMYLSSYNNNVISAVNKAGVQVKGPWGATNGNAWDLCIYKNKIFYLSYSTNYQIMVCDLNLNYLTSVSNSSNWYSYRGGITVDPATGVFMATAGSSNYTNIYFFKINPDNYAYTYLGTDANWYAARNDEASYTRTLCWVPEHAGGNLWTNLSNYVYQYDIDVVNYRVNRMVQRWAKPAAWSKSYYDGIGHDGKNLWVKRYDSNLYYIIDDGIMEGWITFDPGPYVVEPHSDKAFVITFLTKGRSGQYNTTLTFSTNDPNRPKVEVPVEMNVLDGPAIDITWSANAGWPKTVDYNRLMSDIYVGGLYKAEMKIKNLGNAALSIDQIASDHELFQPDKNAAVIQAGDSTILTVTFEPLDPGLEEGNLIIQSNDLNRDEIVIGLRASAGMPPEMTLDWEEWEETLGPGGKMQKNLRVGNVGAVPLNLAFDTELQGFAEQVGQHVKWVTWNRYPSSNMYKAGIAYDAERNWMWVSGYSNNYLGALDCGNNYAEVKFANSNTGIMGMVYHKNKLYGIPWSNQYLNIYDTNLAQIGTLPLPFNPTAVAIIPDKELFLMINGNDTNILYVVNMAGQIVSTINNFRTTILGENGAMSSRSLCWVPQHRKAGQLWVGTTGGNISYRAHQFKVNTDNWTFEKVTQIVRDGTQEWDGIGHDGTNLWIGNYNQGQYRVYTDGVNEKEWLYLSPESATVEPGNEAVIMVTLDASVVPQGNYAGDIIIYSNDPLGREKRIPVTLSVVPSGVANILDPVTKQVTDRIDFNAYFASIGKELFSGGPFVLPLPVKNVGNSTLNVDDIIVDADAFSCDILNLRNIGVGATGEIPITFQADEPGEYEGIIILFTDAAAEPIEFEITLVAKAVAPPSMVLDPPEFVIEPMFIGQVEYYPVTVRNRGAATLKLGFEFEEAEEGLRDGAVRQARRVDGGNQTPTRDAVGEEITRVVWGRVGVNSYKAGISLDRERGWLWVSAYSPAYIAALDINDNYREVKMWQPNNVMDITYHNGVIYGCPLSSWIMRYDANGNNLGNWNLPFSAGGLASDPDNNVIFIENENNGSEIYVYTPEGQQIGIINNFRNYVNENIRSMDWVPAHKKGNLWVYNGNRIYQLTVDTANWQITGKVVDFATNLNGHQPYDGVGHDGENLWVGCYGVDRYVIYDDGIKEANWLKLYAGDISREPDSKKWVPIGNATEYAVAPNASWDFTILINTTWLEPKIYQGTLHILNNQPELEERDYMMDIFVEVVDGPVVDVTPGGMEIGEEPVRWTKHEYGKVYLGRPRAENVIMTNVGSTPLSVNDMFCENRSFFVEDRWLQFDLDPGDTVVIPVWCDPVAVGLQKGTFVIECNDERPIVGGAYRFRVEAWAFDGPIMSVLPDEIALRVPSDFDAPLTLTVANLGKPEIADTLFWWTEFHADEEDEVRDGGKIRSARRLDAGPVASYGATAPTGWKSGAVPTRDVIELDGLYAIFQAQSAWGWMDDGMMNRIGIPKLQPGQDGPGWVSYRSDNDLNTVDFSQYNVIVMASGQQSGTWINNHNNNRARLEEFVANGGGLYYEMGNTNGVFAPGGITNDLNGGESNGRMVTTFDKNDANYSLFAEICNTEQGGGRWGIGHVINGNSWCHARFSMGQFQNNANLEWYQTIAVTQNGGEPAVVTYGMGAGAVMVCGSPTGHQWFNWTNAGNWGSIQKEILFYLESMGGSQWFSYNPKKGYILPGDETKIEVQINVEDIPVGETVSGMLDFFSNDMIEPAQGDQNDKDVPDVRVPIAFMVVDATPVAFVEPNRLDYTGLVVNEHQTRTIIVSNKGNEPLEITDASFAGDDADFFSIFPEIEEPIEVEEGDLVRFKVTYSPDAGGNHQATLVFSTNIPNDDDGDVYVNLSGVCKDSPTIDVDAEGLAITLDDLMKETGELEFVVSNTGEGNAGPLSWSMSVEDDAGIDRGQRQARRLDFGIESGQLPQRDEPQSRFALFQLTNPWGYDIENIFKNVYGLQYDRYSRPDELANIDLNEYDVIWFANNQIDSWNQAHNDHLALIEEWVAEGGVYYMSDGTVQWNVTPKHPGGLVRKAQVYDNPGVVAVRSSQNYLVKLMGWELGTELWGKVFSHATYPISSLQAINNSNYHQVLVTGKLSEEPIVVLYGYGEGHCVVSGTVDGYMHSYPEQYEWGKSGEEMIWYLDELAIGSSRWIRATPPMGNLNPGEEQTVTVIVDAGKVQGAPGQEFRSNIILKSNDVENPEVRIPVVLTLQAEPDWAVTPSDRSHTVFVADVTFDGRSGKGLWVGAFDPQGVCVAFGRWLGAGQMVFTMWGDNPATQADEGFISGDQWTFVLRDMKTDEVYSAVRSEVVSGFPRWAFQGVTTLKIHGSSRALEEEQTISFKQGWNLVSLNIKPVEEFYKAGETRGPDVMKILAKLKPEQGDHHVILMKDAVGRFAAPAYGFNNIPFWNLGEAYWIKTDNDLDATWRGAPIPSDEPIALKKGVNLVPYYPGYELPVTSPEFYAIAPIANSVEILKDENGRFATPKFKFSNMGMLKPGAGYMIRTTQAVNLRWPGKSMDLAGVNQEPIRNGRWVMNPMSDLSMNLLVENVNGVALANGDEIAAFDSRGNIVGSAVVSANGAIGLAIWGDDPSTNEVEGLANGEAFELKLYSSVTRSESRLAVAGVKSGDGLLFKGDALTVVNLAVTALTPSEYYLSSAYPNPFNAVTRLTYGMPDAADVTIKLFDIAGREVATLFNGHQSAGHHAVVWNSTGNASGVYLVRMESGNFKSVKKLMLIK